MFEEKNGSFGSDVVMFCLSIKKLMIFQVQKPLRFFVSGTNWRSYKKNAKVLRICVVVLIFIWMLGRGSKIRYQRKEF